MSTPAEWDDYDGGEDALRDEHLAAAGVDPFDEPDPSWDDPGEFEGDDDGA